MTDATPDTPLTSAQKIAELVEVLPAFLAECEGIPWQLTAAAGAALPMLADELEGLVALPPAELDAKLEQVAAFVTSLRSDQV